MTWLLTFVIGILTALAGCFGAGLLGMTCVDWFRIPAREGASGYYVIAFGLVGTVFGLVLGIVSSRVVAGMVNPTFLKGLGVAFAAALAVLLLATLGAWLKADFPPRLDGHSLIVETELSLPASVVLPVQKDPYGYTWGISLTADHGDRSQRAGPMRTAEAVKVDGRWLVRAGVSLHTSDAGKSMGVTMGTSEPQFFTLAIPSRPTRADMNWSEWQTEPRLMNRETAPKVEAVAMRYRVQFYVPPPPAPPGLSYQEREAQAAAEEAVAFAALPPSASLESWLAHTEYSKPQARREAAAAVIAQRPDVSAEMSAAIRSDNEALASCAARAVALMKDPPAGLSPAVLDLGAKIVEDINAANRVSLTADPSFEWPTKVMSRFVSWHEAARVLHGRSGVTMAPAMEALREVARVRPQTDAMNEIVRVSSYYIDAWSGNDALNRTSK